MELGNKKLNTMLDAPDARVYPSLYLDDADANAVPDPEPGDERLFTGQVRISGVESSKGGERSIRLEIIELQVEGKEKPTAADRAYPTMAKD
jgi:hypothetical protein